MEKSVEMQYGGIHGYIGHGVEANAVKGSLSEFSKPLAMLGVQRGRPAGANGGLRPTLFIRRNEQYLPACVGAAGPAHFRMIEAESA